VENQTAQTNVIKHFAIASALLLMRLLSFYLASKSGKDFGDFSFGFGI
jgi:hypothetical protein